MQPQPESPNLQPKPRRQPALSGSQVEPEYRVRRTVFYPVDEGDMDSLTHINTEMSVCLALTTFFLGVLASLWIAIWITPPSDQSVTRILEWLLTPILVVLVLVSGIGTAYFWQRRETVTGRIYSESGGRSVEVKPKA